LFVPIFLISHLPFTFTPPPSPAHRPYRMLQGILRSFLLVLSALLALQPGQGVDAATFAYDGFRSPANLVLQANAALLSDRLRVTPAAKAKRGGVWLGDKQPVGVGFETTFQFQITDPCTYGGNGFAFVVQNNPTPVLGGFGHNSGFF